MTAGSIRTVGSHARARGFFANRSNCTGRSPEVRTWDPLPNQPFDFELTLRAGISVPRNHSSGGAAGGWPKWVNHITVSFLQNRKSSIGRCVFWQYRVVQISVITVSGGLQESTLLEMIIIGWLSPFLHERDDATLRPFSGLGNAEQLHGQGNAVTNLTH